MDQVDGIPSHGIDLAEKMIKQIDELTNEIDQLAAKELNEADDGYINQGNFVVRTKLVISSLQNDAHRSTTKFSSALEQATFDDETTDAAEGVEASSKRLSKIVAAVEEDIKSGMACLKSFNSLCDKTDEFCIKLEQVCENQIKTTEAQRFQGNISALVVTEIALVLGFVAVVIGVLQAFQIDNIIAISIGAIALTGVAAYAIAKVLSNRKSSIVFNDTIASLERTRSTLVSLKKTIDEFRMVQRQVVSCADDILQLISHFKDADSQIDDFVSTLHTKCQELQKYVSMYKNEVAAPIKNLEEIDANFS